MVVFAWERVDSIVSPSERAQPEEASLSQSAYCIVIINTSGPVLFVSDVKFTSEFPVSSFSHSTESQLLLSTATGETHEDAQEALSRMIATEAPWALPFLDPTERPAMSAFVKSAMGAVKTVLSSLIALDRRATPSQ